MKKRRFILEFPLESFLISDKEISSPDKTVRLVPNPCSNNLLSKAIVEIKSGLEDKAEDEAYNTLSCYLSILSYEWDSPIRISGPPTCHEIGPTDSGRTAHGISYVLNALLVRRVYIDRLPDIAKYKSMQDALACYREARNSTNEFHQYLNYYKMIENLLDVKRWRDLYRKLEQASITVGGKPISREQAKTIYKDYRCALVHALKKPILTRDRAEDLRRVRKGLEEIKDIARQCLDWKKRSLEVVQENRRG